MPKRPTAFWRGPFLECSMQNSFSRSKRSSVDFDTRHEDPSWKGQHPQAVFKQLQTVGTGGFKEKRDMLWANFSCKSTKARKRATFLRRDVSRDETPEDHRGRARWRRCGLWRQIDAGRPRLPRAVVRSSTRYRSRARVLWTA